MKTKCEFCLTENTVDLSSVPEHEREIYRLSHIYTLEDRYTDSKANAFNLWLIYWLSIEREEGVTQTDKNIKDAAPAVRAAAKLKEQVEKLYEERHKVLRTKYGANPFPEHERLVDQIRNREKDRRAAGGYVAGLHGLEQKRINHLVCADLEKVIWGETRGETLAVVKNTEQRIEELIRAAKEEL